MVSFELELAKQHLGLAQKIHSSKQQELEQARALVAQLEEQVQEAQRDVELAQSSLDKVERQLEVVVIDDTEGNGDGQDSDVELPLVSCSNEVEDTREDPTKDSEVLSRQRKSTLIYDIDMSFDCHTELDNRLTGFLSFIPFSNSLRRSLKRRRRKIARRTKRERQSSEEDDESLEEDEPGKSSSLSPSARTSATESVASMEEYPM